MINGELARRRNLTESSSHQHFSPENLNLTTSRIVARRNCGVKLLTGGGAEKANNLKGKGKTTKIRKFARRASAFHP
jgi:hypothetical protein